MITIHDLLEDPVYREFFCKVPELPKHGNQALPWRLWVKLKKDKKWRYKDYATYREAFVKLKSLLPRALDASISAKSAQFNPPHKVVRVKNKYQTDKQGRYVLDKEGKKKQITKMIVWKPKRVMDEFEEHIWCPYCRRPTVFQFYTQHHALLPKKTGGMPIDPSVQRCTICGASERIVDMRKVM